MTDELEPTPPPAVPVTPMAPSAPTVPSEPASRPTLPAQAFEPETAWTSPTAPTDPVVAAGASARTGRARWAIGLGVIAVVLATSVLVAFLITGRSATSSVVGYVPADAVTYGEVRLDLPGDQRRAVAAFLAKFPGFADQAALDSKLDQVLDDLVKSATSQDQTYTRDIKPWFDGEIAFSVGALPPAGSVATDPGAFKSIRALALVSIKDPVAAQAWFGAAIAKSGMATTTEAYGGATLTVFGQGTGPQAAFAVLGGKVAVAGDLASVKAAVDTKGAGGFAAAAGPKAAIGSATGDHVGFVYTSLRSLAEWSNTMSQAAAPPGVALGQTILKALPDWGAYWLRFENDAIVLEAVAPKAQTPLGPTTNRSSAVVEHIPRGAIVASSTNDFGKTLKQTLDLYRSEPAIKPTIDQLDQALGLVGGEDGAFGWAGDTAIVVNVADGVPEGGLIVAPTDKTAAEHLLTSLRAFIALGGAQAGLTVRDETYNGSTITVVELADAAKLLGGSLPTGSGLTLPTVHLAIAYAVSGDIVVIGSGSDFVKHVLDTTKATSLASNERYAKLVARAGTGAATAFVDIAAIRGLIEKAVAGQADPAALARYEKDIKPFLTPFDALVVSSSVTGDGNRSVIYITVK